MNACIKWTISVQKKLESTYYRIWQERWVGRFIIKGLKLSHQRRQVQTTLSGRQRIILVLYLVSREVTVNIEYIHVPGHDLDYVELCADSSKFDEEFLINEVCTSCTTSKKGHVHSLKEARKLNLPIAMQLALSDTMVVPILLYGVDMWGSENCNFIEHFHMKFCKTILKVTKKYSSLYDWWGIG